ncbi:hypothetical protein CDIK_0719 [Cucumispora dikerogammari]|nr:hypothetical protein CDIK_0719 [Cucumispora dikerogammari]
MNLLYFLNRIFSKKPSSQVSIRSISDNLYLNSSGIMQKDKTYFFVEKDEKLGKVIQTLYDSKKNKPIRFKYRTKTGDGRTTYVPLGQDSVSFNYTDLPDKKGRIEVGIGNCLTQGLDNSVYVQPCSKEMKNNKELFIIETEKNHASSSASRESEEVSDELYSDDKSYDNRSELAPVKNRERKIYKENVDYDKDENYFKKGEVYDKYDSKSTVSEDESLSGKTEPIYQKKEISLKRSEPESGFIKSNEANNKFLSSFNRATNVNYDNVLNKIKDILYTLTEQLIGDKKAKDYDIQDNKRNKHADHSSRDPYNDKHGFNIDELERQIEHKGGTEQSTYGDTSRTRHKRPEDHNKYNAKNKQHELSERDTSGQNAYSNIKDKVFTNYDNSKYANPKYPEITQKTDFFNKKLKEIFNKKKEISKNIINDKSGNIESASFEIKNMLDQIKTIRTEFIQKAQDKANEYLDKLNNLSVDILKLSDYIEHIKTNTRRGFNKLRTGVKNNMQSPLTPPPLPLNL